MFGREEEIEKITISLYMKNASFVLNLPPTEEKKRNQDKTIASGIHIT